VARGRRSRRADSHRRHAGFLLSPTREALRAVEPHDEGIGIFTPARWAVPRERSIEDRVTVQIEAKESGLQLDLE
jgi:hypothetical protein